MAVPKKRTSSSKTKSRHATWVNKAIIALVKRYKIQHSILFKYLMYTHSQPMVVPTNKPYTKL